MADVDNWGLRLRGESSIVARRRPSLADSFFTRNWVLVLVFGMLCGVCGAKGVFRRKATRCENANRTEIRTLLYCKPVRGVCVCAILAFEGSDDERGEKCCCLTDRQNRDTPLPEPTPSHVYHPPFDQDQHLPVQLRLGFRHAFD